METQSKMKTQSLLLKNDEEFPACNDRALSQGQGPWECEALCATVHPWSWPHKAPG